MKPRAPFADFDFRGFWDDSAYAKKAYVEGKPSPKAVASIEAELGYVLPASYVWLMTRHNGGTPARTCFRTKKPTSWAEDHVAIVGISAIGRTKSYSLCGELGSRFMIDEWGYPPIGVVFADCPSAGHDVVMFDYRKCGPRGEPRVVHVDQERDYAITPLAKDFETFVRGLVDESELAEDEEDLADAETLKVRRGKFSPLLARLCKKARGVEDVEGAIRALAEEIVDEKGSFLLHGDPLSRFFYDVQLWLYAETHPVFTREKFLADYEKIVTLAGEFSTGGYAPEFVTDWLRARVRTGAIVRKRGALALSAEARAKIARRLSSIAPAAGRASSSRSSSSSAGRARGRA